MTEEEIKARKFAIESKKDNDALKQKENDRLKAMREGRQFNEDEYEELLKEFYVQKVDGMTASEAASKISTNGLSTLYGTLDMDADTIVAQTYPSYTATLYKTGVVVMYPEGVTESQFLTTKVPNLSGMTAIECIEACLDLNLNCKIDGDVGGVCVSQDYAIGETVYAGEIIHVTLVKDAVVETTETEETAPPDDGTSSEDGVVTDIAPPPDEEDGEPVEGQDT
jgi:stage V sporulation protein D (sporulation-specific penicillin-binding protein)